MLGRREFKNFLESTSYRSPAERFLNHRGTIIQSKAADLEAVWPMYDNV